MIKVNVKNIIVVDDDRSIRVVISTALTRAGYNVKSSVNEAGMWRMVESDFEDVLITDVGLPDGDALDILPKLQKNNPKLFKNPHTIPKLKKIQINYLTLLILLKKILKKLNQIL